MFVKSNKLVDLLPYFKTKLANIFSDREIETVFSWVCEDKYNLSKFELKHTDLRLSESELLAFRSIVKRLANNEPIHYILGTTEFYNCKIKVNKNVLIPRPETEELVDLVLKNVALADKVLDIGTGSGCIPIALKKANPSLELFGIDISQKAIDLAAESALLNKVTIQFRKIDILTNDLAQFPLLDCIVSNPPYIIESDKKEMATNVLDFEPHLALFVADTEPLLFYERIAKLACHKLKSKGKLFFEIHESYSNETKTMLLDLGFTNVEILKDLQGKNRMIFCLNS